MLGVFVLWKSVLEYLLCGLAVTVMSCGVISEGRWFLLSVFAVVCLLLEFFSVVLRPCVHKFLLCQVQSLIQCIVSAFKRNQHR